MKRILAFAAVLLLLTPFPALASNDAQSPFSNVTLVSNADWHNLAITESPLMGNNYDEDEMLNMGFTAKANDFEIVAFPTPNERAIRINKTTDDDTYFQTDFRRNDLLQRLGLESNTTTDTRKYGRFVGHVC